LPQLTIHDHVIPTDGPSGDSLFPELSVKGLQGRLSARRGSLDARVSAVSSLVASDSSQWLVWCGLNPEAAGVSDAGEGAGQVAGDDTYAEKVGAVQGFVSGQTRVLVSKVRILGYGLNFQHCHNIAFVGLGDSYEQYYQAIRRCWRFGQQHPVNVHVVVSEAEQAVVANVRRKEQAAATLSSELLAHMREFEREEIA